MSIQSPVTVVGGTKHKFPRLDTFRAYKKLFASSADEHLCWWYFGTLFVDIPGYQTIPVIQSETAMIYRVETLSEDLFQIHWREIGYFRDPLTGEMANKWTNPITGQRVGCPRAFEEGPGCTTVSVSDNGGIVILLAQPFAVVRSVEVAITKTNGRIQILQTERKERGYPQEDGSLPQPGSTGTSEALTVISIFGDGDAVGDDTINASPASGSYEFSVGVLPPGWDLEISRDMRRFEECFTRRRWIVSPT